MFLVLFRAAAIAALIVGWFPSRTPAPQRARQPRAALVAT
jgi:hypothetical protein